MSDSNKQKIELFESIVSDLDASMNLVELAYLRLKQLNKHSSEHERMETLNEFNRCVHLRDELSARLNLILKEIGIVA